MRATWESQEDHGPRITRRKWVQLGLAGAAVAAGAALTGGGVYVLHEVLPPPSSSAGTVSNTLRYTAFPTPQWWNAKDGDPVSVTDFGVWQGASAVWRGVFGPDGTLQPGTGYPVLVIRAPRVDAYYGLPNPSPWALPSGFALVYDDPSRDLRIVAGLDRCTHLCCYPGWHVVTNPPPQRDYIGSPPTYEVYHEDPIYCVCHGTQYDPLEVIADTNPYNGVLFPGMRLVHGPGTFAMPLIPLRAVNDALEGGMADSRWYQHC